MYQETTTTDGDCRRNWIRQQQQQEEGRDLSRSVRLTRTIRWANTTTKRHFSIQICFSGIRRRIQSIRPLSFHRHVFMSETRIILVPGRRCIEFTSLSLPSCCQLWRQRSEDPPKSDVLLQKGYDARNGFVRLRRSRRRRMCWVREE